MTRAEAIQKIAAHHFRKDTDGLGTSPLRTSRPIAYLKRSLGFAPLYDDLKELAPAFPVTMDTDLEALAADVASHYRAMLSGRMTLLDAS